MSEIIIRKAVSRDLPTLRRFQAGVIEAERPFDPTLKDGQIEYYDIEELLSAPDTELLIADLGDQSIGCGFARLENSKAYLEHERHSYLGMMYVAPEFRGKGVNRRIVESLIDWSLAQKVTEIRLEVYAQNLPAIRAYEKAGFTKHLVEMRLGINEVPNLPEDGND